MGIEARVKESLNACREAGEIVAIHLRPDDLEAFRVGYVLGTGYDSFEMRLVTPSGSDGGLLSTRYSEVLRMHRASPYLHLLHELCAEASPGPTRQPLAEADSLLDQLRRASVEGRVVDVHVEGPSTYCGFVTAVWDDAFDIHTLDEAARPAGRFLVDAQDLLRIESDSPVLIALEQVHARRVLT